ncbi:hypothetical protein ACLOJK_005678 [Asimina triloba]
MLAQICCHAWLELAARLWRKRMGHRPPRQPASLARQLPARPLVRKTLPHLAPTGSAAMEEAGSLPSTGSHRELPQPAAVMEEVAMEALPSSMGKMGVASPPSAVASRRLGAAVR